jgi:hypothetical protein
VGGVIYTHLVLKLSPGPASSNVKQFPSLSLNQLSIQFLLRLLLLLLLLLFLLLLRLLLPLSLILYLRQSFFQSQPPKLMDISREN